MADTRLCGTWALVASRLVDEHGAPIEPYGADPIGRVTYDSGGNMTVQITAGQRPVLDAEDPHEVEPDDVVAAFAVITTYFGTYDVDLESRRIRHHIEGGSHPNWSGRTLERTFRFEADGDRLVLIVNPYRVGRVEVTGELEWVRIG